MLQLTQRRGIARTSASIRVVTRADEPLPVPRIADLGPKSVRPPQQGDEVGPLLEKVVQAVLIKNLEERLLGTA